MKLRSGEPRQRTIRFRLACLVLACVLPVSCVAVFFVHHAYQEKQHLLEQRVLETARALSTVVDQELTAMQASATTLATSPYLVSGDLEAFHRQAQAVVREYPEADIVLADVTGQQLVNSFVPFGTRLPKRSISYAMQVFETGKPVISNLFKGALTGRYIVGVEVPVIHDGRVIYELAMTVPANHFVGMLWHQSIPREWIAAIEDGNRVLVARSQLPERYVGLPATPDITKRTPEAREGVVETISREGIPLVSIFSRLTTTDWSVVIGIPKAAMLAELRHWLWWTVGGTILLSMMGIALALFLARRIAGSIHALVAPALMLGSGEPVEVGALDLAETNEVGQSLVKASQLLQERKAERERAEQEVVAAKELAENALAQFRATIDSMNEGMFVVTPDRKRPFVNAAYFRIYGFEPDSSPGAAERAGSLLERYDLNGRLLPLEEQPASLALRGETVVQREVRVRRVDTGREVITSVNCTPVRDASGRVVMAVITIEDVTEHKRAEQALLRSEKLASVGRMAATIAHEINNPLEAVMNMLFIAKSVSDPESMRQYLEMADAELKRIAHITQQSLGFYRESNAPALMSVNALLESVVDLLKNKIKAKRAVIEKQWDGETRVTAVAGELRQVFSNLLSNSLDASDEEGTIKLRVSSGSAFKNGNRYVRVTVADNGKGIRADLRQHIFEPFFTTKGTVGTGLGLWVSKQIIDKYGGSIRVRSNTNGSRRGTTISVLLPAEPTAHSQSPAA